MIEEKTNSLNEVNFSSPPKTWLVESILVTILCCMPFGIAGIVNASKVESLYNAGDVNGAERASKEAGKWTKIGFWITLGGLVLYFLFFAVILMFGVSNGAFD